MTCTLGKEPIFFSVEVGYVYRNRIFNYQRALFLLIVLFCDDFTFKFTNE